MLGYCGNSWSFSSLGNQVSTKASRQFINKSTFSALQLDLVKGPANLQSPPNPQLCRKCSCCCEVSSHIIMFSKITFCIPMLYYHKIIHVLYIFKNYYVIFLRLNNFKYIVFRYNIKIQIRLKFNLIQHLYKKKIPFAECGFLNYCNILIIKRRWAYGLTIIFTLKTEVWNAKVLISSKYLLSLEKSLTIELYYKYLWLPVQKPR